MHVNRNDIPAKIDIPGAKARQATEFGDTTAGTLAGEFFTLGAGTDIAPLLEGLEDDACQAPHWGYMLSGSLVVTFALEPKDAERVVFIGETAKLWLAREGKDTADQETIGVNVKNVFK